VGSEPSKVLELVVFKLRDPATRERFLGTVDAVSEWARQQPGFLSRELSYDADGERWIDLVWWRTMDEAKAAAEVALSSESCAPMFALIDEKSMQLAHGELATPPVHAAPAVVGK
jgi:hypothetical protein